MTRNLLVLVCLIPASTGFAQEKSPFAGPTAEGYLLPNGWHLTPVGKHFATTDLPLNIVPLKDGKRALVATSGYNQHNLYLVDISVEAPKALATGESRQSWFGLAANQAEEKIWWSGGGAGRLHTFDLKDNTLAKTSQPEPTSGRADAKPAKEVVPAPSANTFLSGVALDEAKSRLYSLNINLGELNVIDLKDGSTKTLAVGGRPYDIVVGKTQLFISDWSGSLVLIVDPIDLRVVGKIPVGNHPNQMTLHSDGRLFVACANSNAVSVIDTRRGIVVETIFTALFPKSPEGSTPDAVALTPDGKTLFVANADNNCIAVVDVETPRQSGVRGFIPTGWYPRRWPSRRTVRIS